MTAPSRALHLYAVSPTAADLSEDALSELSVNNDGSPTREEAA